MCWSFKSLKFCGPKPPVARHAPMSGGAAQSLAFAAGPQACLIQHYQLAEWDGFAPRLRQQEERGTPPVSLDALQLISLGSDPPQPGHLGTAHMTASRAATRFCAPSHSCPAKRRAWWSMHGTRPTPASIIQNASITWAAAHPLPADLFLHPPTHLLDLKAHLF